MKKNVVVNLDLWHGGVKSVLLQMVWVIYTQFLLLNNLSETVLFKFHINNTFCYQNQTV